jgi:hypothetical protein
MPSTSPQGVKPRLTSKADLARKAANQRRRYSRHKNKINALFAELRTKPRGRALVLWCSAKHRAKRYKLQFDLPKEWIEDKLIKGCCDMTGIQFDLSTGGGRRNRHPYAPSIDRINSSGGYTVDNCRVVIWHVNTALAQYGDEALYKLAEALVARRKQANRKPRNKRTIH